MLAHDPRGEPVVVGDPGSIERLEAALMDVVRFRGDPVGKIEAALLQDPDLVLGHCLRAHVLLFALQPSFRPKAAASLAAAEARAGAAGLRERLHIAAGRAWLAGEPAQAAAAFDTLLEAHPRDLLALMFAHQADFFAAAEAGLRQRPERALTAWGRDLPGYGYVLGMRAFGCEEAGDYAAAEAGAAEALTFDARDVWAIHAQGHVLEMQGRTAEGIAWYTAREPDWAEDCFFSVHNAWHLALYHVECCDDAGALAVYDRLMRPTRRSIVLNLCDAAALLWRLHLMGVPLAERPTELAELFSRQTGERVHVFNDVHALMALATAERWPEAEAVLAGMTELAYGPGQQARITRDLGLPAGRALVALAQGRADEAADLLLACRPAASLMTGSRAQRDVLELTLIEAALRAARLSLARELLEARLRQRPTSQRARADLARCGVLRPR